LRLAIEEKELVRSLVEIGTAGLDVFAEDDAAGVELLLLHAAIRTAAAPAATAVSPALAVMEYNESTSLIEPRHARACARPNPYPGSLRPGVYWRKS
jgi:hypothetical protein